MYKQITAGNLYDLIHKMKGRKDCNIFIKPMVDFQIEKMSIEDYNTLVLDLKERNITLIVEGKDGILKKLILNEIPIEDGE